jgi:hypothetical protein
MGTITQQHTMPQGSGLSNAPFGALLSRAPSGGGLGIELGQ